MNKKGRISFRKLPFEVKYPDLLGLQLNSFKSLFRIGRSGLQKEESRLSRIFQDFFPVSDAKENFVLEFLEYIISSPCYTPDECLVRGITYDVSLRVRMRLTCKDSEGTTVTEEEVYLANVPYMTPSGSFIFRGIERVVISQLQRSYGIFFSQNKHASGVSLFSAKIIPVVGAWIEFSTDMHKVMYVYLDRRNKMPITVLLRALGYGTDRELLTLFGLAEEVKVNQATLKKYKGRLVAEKILKTWEEYYTDEEVDEVSTINRYEVILERGALIDDEAIEKLINSEKNTVFLLKEDIREHAFSFIYNSLQKDDTNSEQEAIEYIYCILRSAAAPDEQAAREFVKHILFSPKRAFLGSIGRRCLNKKLAIDTPETQELLEGKDILAVVKKFPDLISGKQAPEDVDSLVNRLVRSSGDFIADTLRRGIRLVAHYAKEILNTRSDEELKPFDVMNGHYIVSAMKAFLGFDPNAQFMDQTNPLSELEHKRRNTKLSKSLSRERAGLASRDLNPSYYSRLCPIGTPEGANIGLITHFALYTQIDPLGFVQAPFKKVINGVIQLDKNHYLTAEDEEKKIIAQYTREVDKTGKITAKQLTVRDAKGEFFLTTPDKVDYIDLGSDQFFSAATSLIPFPENTEATRASMGSNMQRQALPLLRPEAPIVGTGQEARIARDARVLMVAEEDGIVVYVDAKKVVIKRLEEEKFHDLSFEPINKTYNLTSMRRTNQGGCIRQTPVVRKGDKVKKGDFLCEGYAIKDGELALGYNARVAIMPYDGYSFEDSIVISEKLVREDRLTSLHIVEFTVDLYNTKLGAEEFTSDIPGVSEEALEDLDERGIVRVGKEVKEGDILVGKITPQSNENPSPENKLMAAIFGNLASNIKDVSFKVPFVCKGTVIKTQILEGPSVITSQQRKELKEKLKTLEKQTREELVSLQEEAAEKLYHLLQDEPLKAIQDLSKTEIFAGGKSLTKQWVKDKIFINHPAEKLLENVFPAALSSYKWTSKVTKNEEIAFFFESYGKKHISIVRDYEKERNRLQVSGERPPGVIKQAVVTIAKKCRIEVGDKLSGRHGNKGVISKIVREEDMPHTADGKPIEIIINSHSIPSRMNIGQVKEVVLGGAGKTLGVKYAMPIFEGASVERINEELAKAGLPAYGRVTLYDGLTGKPFEQKVTTGILYTLKLDHLVQHKIHARSSGPYTLITQAPVGGRVRIGGQRVGEMEGWAIEAHGAAYTLREMLTVKSDDVYARQKTHEALYKGHNVPEPCVTESLKILEQKLASICIDFRVR